MTLDPHQALARCLERESTLLWCLKELIVALDESQVGPLVNIVPRWQLERIEAAIESSEEELAWLRTAIETAGQS